MTLQDSLHFRGIRVPGQIPTPRGTLMHATFEWLSEKTVVVGHTAQSIQSRIQPPRRASIGQHCKIDRNIGFLAGDLKHTIVVQDLVITRPCCRICGPWLPLSALF